MEYEEIAKQLQLAFPNGTLQKGKSVHIPVQAYIRRLEDAAGGTWSWSLVDNPVVQEQDHAVVVRGELKIGDTVRSGVGFSFYERDPSARSVSTYKNAVSSAESDAIRNACDKYLMGWVDLAPYRDWGKNPGVLMEEPAVAPSTNRLCKRCKRPLKSEDELFLELHSIKLPFCSEHVPAHLHKK